MSDLPGEREIGGLRCGQVLAGLTEYLAGGLEPSVRARVEAHVAACDRCAAFGGAFGEAIAKLRAGAPDPRVDDAVEAVLGRLPR